MTFRTTTYLAQNSIQIFAFIVFGEFDGNLETGGREESNQLFSNFHRADGSIQQGVGETVGVARELQ